MKLTHNESKKYSGITAVFCLIYCKATDKFLFELRSSDCDDPLTWGLFGGGLHSGEQPLPGIIRELREETGFKIKAFDYATNTVLGRNIVLYVKILDKPSRPKLSWESESYRYVSDLDFVKPLHPGMERNYNALKRLMHKVREFSKTGSVVPKV